ncbi:porin family protein [Aestuariivivens sediminicola]|uniref:porin family protein n=1 Tax=Aestuariivivens sediminicola TaxID=2913560 RepID=UPI001F58EAD8|nr:porin family protein [Aestuariivivens sediminicola]
MQRLFILWCFILLSILAYAQEETTMVVDSLYREDQFYVGVTYNLLSKAPTGLSQNGFSGGYHLGFIRDIPFNKGRNFGLGLGFGLSANSYNQNLFIDKDNTGNMSYTILDERSTFTKNKLTTYLVEFPLEIRWRTSTPLEYKFWRIYTGIKFGYVIANGSKYKGDLGTVKHDSIDQLNKFQYGLSISVGYNTWNIHCYYGLNPIFSNEAQINGTSIAMRTIKIGLLFYML